MRSPRLFAAVLVASLASLSTPALAAGPPPHGASRAQFEKAQTFFEKAKKQYETGKIADALEGFKKSYEIVASPISRLYLARALVLLGREREGFNELVQVRLDAAIEAASDPKYNETRAAAEQERTELEAKVAVVRVRADGGDDATLTVAGASVARAAWGEPIALAPGKIEVVLASPSRTEKRTVEVRVGAPSEVAISVRASTAVAIAEAPPSDAAESAERRRRTLRTGAYVAAGVGVVGAIGFVAFGSIARSKFNSLKDQCAGPCDASRQGEIDAGKRDTTLANVGLVVGVVGVAAGVTLFALSAAKEGAPPAASAKLEAGAGWVGVSGRFLASES